MYPFPIEKRFASFSPQDAMEISEMADRARYWRHEAEFAKRFVLIHQWPTLLAGFFAGVIFCLSLLSHT